MDKGSDIKFVKEAESSKSIEKSAKESPLDTVKSTVTAAGKPTNSGLLAGAGLGSALAALGALHRSGSSGKHSILSNPLILGTLGLTGGYLAGNSLDSAVNKKRSAGDSNVGGLASLGALGTLGVGKSLADEDKLLEIAPTKARYNKALAKVTRLILNKGKKGKIKVEKVIDLLQDKLSGEEITEFGKAKEALKRVFDRNKGLAGMGGLGEPASWAKRNLVYSTWSPIQQIKALNPFKHVEGQPSGIKAFGKQLSRLLFKAPLKSPKAAVPRIAALTAALGLSGAGINKIRNKISGED